jgi:AAA domain/Primase C terminal 1 (PriCT-1)
MTVIDDRDLIAEPRVEEFLSLLFAGATGKIELRAIARAAEPHARPAQIFTSLGTGTTQRGSFLARYSHAYDLYLGIADRKDASSGRLENCLTVAALWVDVDFKSVPEAEARQFLAEFPVPPSCVVRSGGGLHCYWLLKERLPVTDLRLRAVIRRLALRLHGDLSSAEPARMLRVPGTLNHKYTPPRPVVIEVLRPERQWVLGELLPHLPVDPESQQPQAAPAGDGVTNGHPARFTLPERIREGERNSTLFKLGRSLKARGLSAESIAAALHEENGQRCEPQLAEAEVCAIAEHAWRQPDRPWPAAAGALLGGAGAPGVHSDGGAAHPGADPGTRPGDPGAGSATETSGPAAEAGNSFSAPKILRGREILAVTIAEPDWTVERLFSHGNQHMIVGASQGAKTWLLFALGVALAHEGVTQCLGQRVLRHGRVLIESWEQGQREDVRRIQKLVTGHGMKTCDDNLILISEPSATLVDESHFAERLRTLKAWGVTCYLFDSLSEASGIELNDNTAYTIWWRTRVKPILALGCTVICTHLRGHPKAGVEPNRDSASRGATQIRALSTGVLDLKQYSDKLFGVTHNKHRDGPALRLGTLELVGDHDDPSIVLALRDPLGEAQGKARLARELLTQLGEGATPGQALKRSDLEAALNPPGRPKDERVSKKIYEPVLGQMVSEGLFKKGEDRNAHTWAWLGRSDANTDGD